ncbi:hypothetical protein X882_5791 [Burkholderia pseudomallei MSHR4303]|nr:hypothetical protein X882_5791 [Burkholderia pseudomallei MSHR4303]
MNVCWAAGTDRIRANLAGELDNAGAGSWRT